ncbi:altronate dehydratase [Parasedimentitalea marina]|uniref:Altronate dehydratase n=1 Tax=Parasedimentitalea marina TaxID=2483033 RepID=A0A3T0MZ63_9RHOB|nr:altronate dehydratase family protein [Parasedimentitalea marina]AZV77058.1 altronate dehydratase [Parasedimentitalea marina]
MSVTSDTHPVLVLNAEDNVAVALAPLAPGDDLGKGQGKVTQPVPAGHKVSRTPISAGTNVLKYGQIIGRATEDIPAGAHVHSHNLGMGDHKQSHALATELPQIVPSESADQFMGYHRPSGRVGTRNYIGILTSVNCAGSVAKFVAEVAEKTELLKEFGNVDGIIPITHGSGCGMSSKGEGYETLFRTLTGYAQNPNFGAILMIGLGCEVMQISTLVGHEGIRDETRFRFMTIQQSGGTRATVEAAQPILRELAVEANKAQRAPAPASALTVGLQCGGSDGLSGITANPALGVASDLLVAQGGTSILSETSEIYGAEHLLTSRAATPDIAAALLDRIAWWEDYTARNFGEMDNNPSPGNKRGGLTTILEKSLGAVAKAGAAPMNGVFRYAEPIDRPGFVFMDSPGYDPCSVTGQVASGANLIVFTTGRGSASGYKPTPCIKLASNSDMYQRMEEDMDVNCGDIVTGTTLEAKGQEIYRLMLEIASGRPSKSEMLGYGAVEFVPWQIGAVM